MSPDCTDVTATDALGAFVWTCDDSSVPVRVRTLGLAPDKGLTDLIDFATSTWRSNSVTITGGSGQLHSTESTVWWSNPVTDDLNGGLLDAASTIYAVSSTPGLVHELAAPKVALVVAPQAALTGNGGKAVVLVEEQDHFWFEGNVDHTGSSFGILLSSAAVGVVRLADRGGDERGYRHPRGRRSGQSGDGCRSHVKRANRRLERRLSHRGCAPRQRGPGRGRCDRGLAQRHPFERGRCRADCGEHGRPRPFGVGSCAHASGSALGRVVLEGPMVRAADILVASSGAVGIDMFSVGGVLMNCTASMTYLGSGVRVNSASAILSNVVAAGNSGAGLALMSAPPTVSCETSLPSAMNWGFCSKDPRDSPGSWHFGANNADCINQNGGSGLTSACANEAPSNAVVVTGFAATSTFEGKIFVDDPVNTSDVNGAVDASGLADTHRLRYGASSLGRRWWISGRDQHGDVRHGHVSHLVMGASHE